MMFIVDQEDAGGGLQDWGDLPLNSGGVTLFQE
jgi:hypothetical protein